jgi:hypothetical protein
LKAAKKPLTTLTKYYGARKLRIILDGKRVKKEWVAWYLENHACFKKEGLVKRIVLHELYHHLMASKGFELSIRTEETEANSYARRFLKN